MSEIKPKKERRFLKTLGRVGEILVEQVLLKLGSSIIKKIGGKKTLPSILFLFLSFTLLAQYPTTGNKQRLGFQTTGDGLVWRGALSDTASIQPINNQNAWVILDTINLKFYTFDFTSNVWNLVGGGGAAFTQPVDSLFFNVNVPTNNVDTAKMRWDSDLATVVLGLNDNVPNELGFKNFWLVKNQTGSTIAKGSLVYANGTVGSSGRITVAKFIANGSIDAKYLLGITAHDLSNGEDGYVISFGKIRQVNTDTFAAGAILYPSPTVAGVWTDVEPIAPNIDMPIGFCINSAINTGTIAIRVASGYKLSELHDVAISSPFENSSLYYKGGLWRDTTAALLTSDTASMLLPYLRDADTVSLSNRINLKLNIADTSAFARDNQISGTSGQVAYFNSSSSVVSDTALRWSAANKSLGINMKTVPSGANLILKNSQEPVRSTVVATQTFGADTTNWTRGAGWTFNGTQAVATAATGALTYTPVLTITSGNAYEITYTLSGYSAGTLTARIGYASYSLPTHNATANVVVLLPTDATGGFRFTTSTFTGNLDNISVVQIANPSSILLMGQDDNSTTNYSPLRMPNSRVIGFGGGAAYTTGTNNTFFGINAGQNTTTGTDNNFFGNNAGQSNTTGFINNFFGLSAGQANTTGAYNNFFGLGAGSSNTTGANNNFFGLRAGLSNTTGTNNNFFGSGAGQANTTGFQNLFIGNGSGLNNTTGSANNFLGQQAGGNNTTGEQNNFFGLSAAFNNTTGSNNTIIGSIAGSNNTIGSNNTFISTQAGHVNRRGSNNISIGYRSMYNTTVADTLTGSDNIVIGANAADNIRAAAAGNVAIGNAVDLPTNNGSNQGVYQNVLFFTGASGTGTTIAAASKAGIKTNAPNRDLEVAGEVRITDLTTDAPTRLVGADADGDLAQVTLGAGLSLASSSLLADTNFLVTRFDTASMLAPYFRDADTTSLNLTSRFAAKLNLSDTSSMLTNYLRTGTAASTYLTQSNAASTYLPLTGGTLSINSSTNYVASANDNANLTLYNSSSNGTNTIYNGLKFFVGATGGAIPGGEGQANIYAIRRGSNLPGTDLSFILKGAGVNENEMLERLRIKYDGKVGIGTTAPSYLLDVNGTFNATGASLIGGTLGVTGEIYLGNKTFVGNYTDNTPTSGGNHNIRLESNDVSSIGFHDHFNTIGNIKFSGATGFVIGASDGLYGPHSTTIAGNATLSAPLTVNSSAVFNEAATDSDFRVESEANANMLFVDASTSKVGIGYASPTKTLDVNGEVRINTVTATPTSLLGKDGSNVVGNVTTVAQTGLMTRGETTATTGTPSATFTVTHGLGATPTSVLVTSAGLAGAEKIIFEVYTKSDTTFSVQAWNYDGTEASSKSVKIFWLAIK